MLSIMKLVFSSLLYYLGLASEDYYLSGGEPPGRWGGGGADALNLAGDVEDSQFRDVLLGIDPNTGSDLVQNANMPQRIPGWDYTWSSPKDFGILSTLSATYQRLRDIQEYAVRSALGFLEKNFAYSRVGSVRKGTWYLKPVRIVAALFEHFTNRDNGVHVHTHSVLANLGIDDKGKSRSLHSSIIFKVRDLLSAYYRAELAYQLHKQLGVVCIRKGDSFRIRGIPKRLVRYWSTRRRAIEQEMKKNGESGGKAAARAALKTRRTKKDIPPRKVLLKRWRRINAARGFGPWSLPRMQKWPHRDPQQDLPRVLAQTVVSMSRQGRHFSEIEFMKETLCEAVNYAIPPAMIPPAVKQHLKSDEQIIPLGEVNGQDRYATKAIIQAERELLSKVDALLDRRGPRANPQLVERILAKYPHLTEEHSRAVRHLTLGRGSLRIADGIAGVAKTSGVLRPCLEIWKKQGYRVIGATPTGQAAHVLEQATGIPSDTINMRLCDFDRRFGFAARHHIKQFGRALRGKRTYRLRRRKPVKVDRKTILVVDEGGMVNSRHMRMLTERVRKGGGTLVLIGDAGQIPPVEGSAPFQSLCARASSATLTKVLRQKEEWARKAVEHFSRGEPGKALKLFADHGLVTVLDDIDEALESLVNDWAEIGIRTPEKSIVLVAANDQSEAANKLCQQRRIAAGQLDPSHRIKIRDDREDGQASYRNVVHVGDRILFTRNDRRFNVRNGFVGTVTGIQRLMRRIAVQLDNGETVVIPVHKFRHLRLGYSMTTHKAQGATVPHVSVLATGGQNLPISYVQGSRAILTTRFYTTKYLLDLDDIENSPLVQQMARKPDLRLAVDILDSNEPALEIRQLSKAQESRQPLARPKLDNNHNTRVTLASAEAQLPPRLQSVDQSDNDSPLQKQQEAVAARRRRLSERRRRQQHEYALAQAELERRHARELAHARQQAALTRQANQRMLLTNMLGLGEDIVLRGVQQCTAANPGEGNPPSTPIVVSPFVDIIAEPPTEVTEVTQELTQPSSSIVHNNSDDLRSHYRSGVSSQQDATYLASSSSSIPTTTQTSTPMSSSVYTVYTQTTEDRAAFLARGAAQTAATEQQTRSRIVQGPC